jgi:indole-3-glycerol phosphate synthase
LPEAQGGTRPGTGILDRIVRTKHAEVEALRSRQSELRDLSSDAPEPRDFRGALAEPAAVSLIAEVKRRSPGAGEIRPGLDPAALARDYRDSGAAALSVLTDRRYFGGTLEELGRIRREVELPLLRKDFVLDPLQVWEARAGGADAVLLIVRILTDERLAELRRTVGY